MNKTKRLIATIGFVLCGGLLAYTTCGQPSVSVGVSVEIRAESDFYEPLTPYGEWVVIGSYGRCWRPGRVEADWRPYSEGYWQRTDAGWYWVSDEPWAWATYHYGRWNLSTDFGWYWVPQIQWAPAWVSWHSGGGYIGWAPLYPSGVRIISPQAYVFVEERHFMEPVRRSTVVVNNTTIINKTVINEAPAPAVIEKASGRKVQAVPVQELRHKTEAAVVATRKTPTATSEKAVQPTVRTEAQPAEKKAVPAAAESKPAVKSEAKPEAKPAATPAVKSEARPEAKPAATPAVKSEARPEAKPAAKLAARPEAQAVAIKEPTGQNANIQPAKQEKSAQPSDKKEQQPAKEKPAASEKNGANPADKDRGDKAKE